MPRPRFEAVLAVRGANTTSRPRHDWRALVVRLIALRTRPKLVLPPVPRALELREIALGIKAFEELCVLPDASGDEVLTHGLEHGTALVVVRAQQRLAAPAFERGLQLPAQVDGVLQPIVEAEAAVGRVAVRSIARDENAARAIALGERDAQVPEADVLDLPSEGKAGGALGETVKVEVVALGAERHRGMEEPAFADVYPAEEPPVALEVV